MTTTDGLLTAAALLEEACARCGLDDWGDLGFVANLDLLVQSCQETADLTPFGANVLRRVVLRHLNNRLFVQAYWAEHARGIGPLEAPVVITGLPRTGTTLLQTLLAMDPANRVLRLWEALHPVPPDRGLEGKDALVAKAETWLAGLYALAPGLRAIHALNAEGPEECDALLQNSFASQHFDDMFGAERYSTWLNGATLTSEYAFYARQLQVLSAPGDQPGRWLLKSPSHLGYLDTLRATFPGVKVVHCHRDPCQAVSSYASLVFAVRSPYTEGLSPFQAGRHAIERATVSVNRALGVRSEASPEDFIDVGYRELVVDPLGVVRRIYARLGRQLDAPTEAAMRHALAESPQHKHGHNRYTLDQFGLTRAQVVDRMGAYIERFPDETAP